MRLLPDSFIKGWYDRVINYELKPLARGALVLRRLTVEMIDDVLGEAIPRGHAAEDAFAQFGQREGILGGETLGR